MKTIQIKKWLTTVVYKKLIQTFFVVLIGFNATPLTLAQSNAPIPNADELYTLYRRYNKKKYKKAMAKVLLAKSEAEKKQGKKSPQYIRFVDMLAKFYYTSGQYPKALPYFSERIIITEQTKGSKHPDYGVALSNLANIYKSTGQYAKAEPLYLKSLAIGKKAQGKARLGYGLSLNGIANLYKEMGQYIKAERNYQKGLQIIAQTNGKADIRYATALNDLADLYYHQKQYKKAVNLYQKNLQKSLKTLQKNHLFHVTILNNVGRILARQKKYAQAENILVKAKDIGRKHLGPRHPDYATALFNLGVLYKNNPDSLFKFQKMDGVEVEYSFLYESRKIRQQVLGKTHPDYTASVDAFADLYEKRGRFAKAEKLYLEAVTIKLEEFKRNKFILSEKGQKAYLKRNETFFNNFRRLVIDRATEKWLSPARRGQLAKKLFDVEAVIKAQLLDGRQRLHHLITQKAVTDPALGAKYKRYKQLKADVAKSINQWNSGEVNIAQYIQKIDTLEKQLYAVAGTNDTNYGFDTIRNQLRKGEAVIEIIKQNTWRRRAISKKVSLNPITFVKNGVREIGSSFRKKDKNYYPVYIVLIATVESKYPKMIFLKDKKLETRYVRAYQKAVLSKKKDKKSYKRFWYKIGKYLKKKDINKAFISLAGVYNRINISTLFNTKTKKYAGEELDIQIVTTSRDVAKNRLQPKSATSITNNLAVLVGRPQYNMALADLHQKEKSFTKVKQGFADLDFPPTSKQLLSRGKRGLRSGWSDLPGTEAEVKAIAGVLKQKKELKVNTYLGGNALELAVKSVQHPKILHIATHGFFVDALKAPKKVEKKKISFSRSGTENNTFINRVTQIARADPMLRSGIVLAGVSSYERASNKPNVEDGVLTAYEAAQMDLQGTELVVLSACETGLGDIDSGEGVYGLQRAFIVAGAKTVILSLWKVDDNATKMLMSKFYEEWIKNRKTKRLAFKAAQKYVQNYTQGGRKIYNSPYYWGAFQMVGAED